VHIPQISPLCIAELTVVVVLCSPICYEELKQGEQIVYCTTSCGNNVHRECFNQWSAQKKRTNEEVTCVYCRCAFPSTNYSPTAGSCVLNRVMQRSLGERGEEVHKEEGHADERGLPQPCGLPTRRQHGEGGYVLQSSAPPPR
jgi:hypothetical protein